MNPLRTFMTALGKCARRDVLAPMICLVLALPAAPSVSAFAYFASPTKWAAWGPGQYEEFQAAPPNGPHRAGVATYSFMAGRLAIDPDFGDLPDHQDLTRVPPLTGVSFTLASLLPAVANESEQQREDRVRIVLTTALLAWSVAADPTNLANLVLSEVQDAGVPAGSPFGAAGDIRLGVYGFTQNVAESQPDMDLLAHAFQPGTEALGSSIYGDIHFRCRLNNDKSSPLYCPNGVLWANDAKAPVGQYDLLTVALHEVGHALGLGHSNAQGSIMAARYTGPSRELSADDVAGIRALYTPIPEPSAALLAATALIALFIVRRRRECGSPRLWYRPHRRLRRPLSARECTRIAAAVAERAGCYSALQRSTAQHWLGGEPVRPWRSDRPRRAAPESP